MVVLYQNQTHLNGAAVKIKVVVRVAVAVYGVVAAMKVGRRWLVEGGAEWRLLAGYDGRRVDVGGDDGSGGYGGCRRCGGGDSNGCGEETAEVMTMTLVVVRRCWREVG
ncbi:hypothetical protein Tco_1024458 [Tanacetum coccineum]